MEKLVKQVVGDVFADPNELSESLLKEYEERNTRKKKDEAWLKKHSSIIKKVLEKMGKSKTDVGNIRVSVSVPDTSHFDMDKVLDYIQSTELSEDTIDAVTKIVVDEEGLMKAIEEGLIDADELKAHAWVESEGTPRLTVKKIKE